MQATCVEPASPRQEENGATDVPRGPSLTAGMVGHGGRCSAHALRAWAPAKEGDIHHVHAALAHPHDLGVGTMRFEREDDNVFEPVEAHDQRTLGGVAGNNHRLRESVHLSVRIGMRRMRPAPRAFQHCFAESPYQKNIDVLLNAGVLEQAFLRLQDVLEEIRVHGSLQSCQGARKGSGGSSWYHTRICPDQLRAAPTRGSLTRPLG